MSAEQVFSLVSLSAGVSWLLLVLMPRVRVVTAIVGFAVPALLAAIYTGLVTLNWATSDGGFSSLADVAALFGNPWILLAGWTHYLAFDLFVGAWEVRDAQRRSVPHLWVVPCLVLTFLFGPAGWLLYLAVRAWSRGSSAPPPATVLE